MPPKRSRISRLKNLKRANECRLQRLIERRSSAVSVSEPEANFNLEAEQVKIEPWSPIPDVQTSSCSGDYYGQVPHRSRGRVTLSADDILSGLDSLCTHSHVCYPPTFASEFCVGLVTTGFEYVCRICGSEFRIGESKVENDVKLEAVFTDIDADFVGISTFSKDDDLSKVRRLPYVFFIDIFLFSALRCKFVNKRLKVNVL